MARNETSVPESQLYDVTTFGDATPAELAKGNWAEVEERMRVRKYITANHEDTTLTEVYAASVKKL